MVIIPSSSDFDWVSSNTINNIDYTNIFYKDDILSYPSFHGI